MYTCANVGLQKGHSSALMVSIQSKVWESNEEQLLQMYSEPAAWGVQQRFHPTTTGRGIFGEEKLKVAKERVMKWGMEPR